MKKILHDEKGVALLVALGTVVILSLLGAASLTVAVGSINQTTWDRASNQAFNLAEAGFNQALGRVRNGTLAAGTFVTKLETGEAEVTVEMLNNFVWRVTSVGAQPTLAEPKARRAVRGTITNLDPREVLLASSVINSMVGGSTVNGPIYVYDKLEISGNGGIYEGPLFIKDNPSTTATTGDLVLSGNGKMGTSAKPIYAFIDGSYPASDPDFHATAVYSDVPDLQMPVITSSVEDMNEQRSDSNLVIDVDATATTDGDTPLVFDKNTDNVTYGSYPGGPYLKWTKNSRLLEINGKVFIDGTLTLGSVQTGDITFNGKGTIVANGDIQVYSEFAPPEGTFPGTNIIGFVTGYQTTIDPKAGDDVYMALYAYSKVTFRDQMTFWGSLMTNSIDFANNTPTLNMVNGIGASMPDGMPEVQVSTSISGWREVQP